MTAALAAAVLAAASAPWQARAVAGELGTQPASRRVVAGYAALSALTAGALAARIPADALPAAVLLIVGGVPLAVVDARSHRLPDRLVGGTLLGVIVAIVLAAVLTRDPDRLVGAVAGAAVMAAFYGLLLLSTAVLGSAAAYGLGDLLTELRRPFNTAPACT